MIVLCSHASKGAEWLLFISVGVRSHVILYRLFAVALPIVRLQGGPKKTVPQFYFCDNFRKCTPILTIFSLLEPEIYDA